jgi:hypothetical protein
MVRIQVFRAPGGGLLVGVPEGYEPLNLLLQLDLQPDPDLLERLIAIAGDPSVETYEIGGDVCWVSVAGATVTVDTGDGARAVTLAREEFRDALLDFRNLRDQPPPEPPRTRPRWSPPG